MNQEDDPLWSVRTVGKYLGGVKEGALLSRQAVSQLVARGLLPAPIFIGTARRWRRSAVVAAVAKIEEEQKVKKRIGRRVPRKAER